MHAYDHEDSNNSQPVHYNIILRNTYALVVWQSDCLLHIHPGDEAGVK